MNTIVSSSPLRPFAAPLSALVAREPALVRFGLALWLAMVPVAIALALDERTVREANVWWKPLKFLLSVGLFSLTTAWFVGLLPPARRRARPIRWVVATIVAAGSFEIGWIVVKAALGEGSHYNVGDALHATMYTLMGAGAVALTATQLVVARELARHGALGAGAWRDAVLLGLVLTFVLGTAAGAVLGNLQPPSAGGLPVLGWHAAGDLRPAHFVGMHAHHLLPLAGLALDAAAPRHARAGLAAVALGYVALWAVLMVAGVSGA